MPTVLPMPRMLQRCALLTTVLFIALGLSACDNPKTKTRAKAAAPQFLPNATPAEVKAGEAVAQLQEMQRASAAARKRPRPNPPAFRPVEGKRYFAYADNTALPSFTVVQRGQPLPLSGPRNKPMLLHLWASWCGPCVKELPELLAFGRKGLVDVVAVSVDDHWPLVVKYFNGKIPTEVAWDPKIVLEPGLGVRSLPTTFLVDSKGLLRLRWNGLQEWNSKEKVQTILNELARPLSK